jgi:hypothetical protein
MGVKTKIPLDLIRAYRRTFFWVMTRPKPWALRIGKPSLALLKLYAEEGLLSAAFITAYHPRGQKTPGLKNRKAQKRLLKQIRQKGYAFIPGMGKDPAGSWPGEPSFLVLGISLKSAAALGRKFRQNAIVFARKKGIPHLVLLR